MNRGILADRDELRALKNRASKAPFDTIYRALRQRCALILESAPVTEAQWRSLWQQGNWGSAIGAARTTQGRVLDLLIAHHIDANTAYRDRAVEELDNLVGWSTWVDPCNGKLAADLCTAEAAVAAVVGLDWLWEDLDANHRRRILTAVREKAVGPYGRAVAERAWWYSCYHSWNAVVNGGCGLAALALADEDGDESTRRACRQAIAGVNPFFDALGREGGWDEGTGYWGYAMRYLLLFGQALGRLRDDQQIFHRPGMDATGLFPVYFTPNGRPASFGDSPGVPLYGTLYLLTRYADRPELLWWLDTYAFHRDVITSGWAAAGLALLFRPNGPTPREPKLEPAKVFHEVGWAALADHWPRPSFYAAVKTGDLSANHSQRDMNSVQLQVDGEMLLTDLGGLPQTAAQASDARAEFYEVQARAHNTIRVAERDQQIAAHGRIIASRSGKAFRYLACDAENACGENVSFVRHVVMAVGPADGRGTMLLVLDDINNGVPEKVETFWHTHGRIELDAESRTGTILGRRAGLHFALASTVKAKADTSSYPLDRTRRDNVLRLTAGVIGRALTASVFSRARIDGAVEIAEDPDGGVCVRAGGFEARFGLDGRYLRLASVAERA